MLDAVSVDSILNGSSEAFPTHVPLPTYNGNTSTMVFELELLLI